MNLEGNITNILLITGTSFLISVLLMYVCRKLAVHLGAIDVPNEARRIHKKPTPRMGGLAIYLSFLFGYIIFGTPSVSMNAVLISSFLLVMVGIFDDIKPISNRYKLIVQLIATAIAIFYGKFLLTELTVFGLDIQFHMWAYPITFFFIMGAINCINFIDGMDGLSGGICSIYFLTVGIIATTLYKLNGLDVLLAFILLGATLGYLKHNFYPAKIFMGDGGSMFLGFMIAIIALIGYKIVALGSFVVPIILLAIPIVDTLLAILRRKLKGESVFMADKEHIHFQLYKYFKSVPKTVIIIYIVDMLFAAVSILYVLGDSKLALLLYAFLLMLFIIFILKTNVLIDWKKKKKEKRK